MSTNDQNLTQPSNQTFCFDFLLFNEENTISSYIYISFERWRQITHFQVETRLGCSKKSKFWIFLVCSTFWAQTILTPTDLTWKCLSPAWGNDKGEVCSIVMRRKMQILLQGKLGQKRSFFAEQWTRSQTGGQIMSTTVLQAPKATALVGD